MDLFTPNSLDPNQKWKTLYFSFFTREFEGEWGLTGYLWLTGYFYNNTSNILFPPLSFLKLTIRQFPHLIVSSELPVARYSPLLAAHLMQPACSFSANFGLSLYCSKKHRKVSHYQQRKIQVKFHKFINYLKLIFTKEDVKTNENLFICTSNDFHVGFAM